MDKINQRLTSKTLENKVLETVFSNDQYDVSGVSLSRKRGFELDYFSYNGEKKEIFPQSQYYKKLHKKIKNQFLIEN